MSDSSIYHNKINDIAFRSNPMLPMIIKACVSFIFFLTPIHDALLAVGVLVALDLFTGVWSAITKKQAFTSSALFRSVPKLILYELAVFMTFIVEQTFFQSVPLVKVVAGFIAATELKSNLENISVITGLNLWEQIRELINPKKPNDRL